MSDAYTPTRQDLKDLAAFFHERSLEEARVSGLLDYCQTVGITFGVRTTSKGPGADLSDDRRKDLEQQAEAWLEQHSPDRFVAMAGQLHSLADDLASVTFSSGSHEMRMAWMSLTLTASRLWGDHPDFNPAWAEPAEEAAEQA
ncbi:hypothetical protein [Streptomyces sp. NPDC046371]|uniref:hypothetical protein n=1 Tax=Streptomyces sp. NPDC046371 TaxID=3154916 RepID=UPI0033E6EA02